MRARIFGTRGRIVQNVIGSARTRVLLTCAVGGALVKSRYDPLTCSEGTRDYQCCTLFKKDSYVCVYLALLKLS